MAAGAEVDVQCDYLIVGAGAAGAALAARLSEDPAARVVLMEAGRARRKLVNRVPATAFLASMDVETNWNFTTEPVPALDGRSLQWSQGRMVGGSSSINGMAWSRGCRADYDGWGQSGCPGWFFDDVLPVFRRMEDSERGASYYHGTGGPVAVRRAGLDLEVGDLFLDAMRGAGFPIVDDINADVDTGFGRYDANVLRGRRHGVAEAYLDPARNRPNLLILSDTVATRLLLEGGRVCGTHFRHCGRDGIVRVAREVILCCGAVKTPQLLLASGIGPADDLQAMGVPVQHELPEVGRNLHNHPSVGLDYVLNKPISAYRHMLPWRAAMIGLRYLATRSGPLGHSYVACGGVFKTTPFLAAPDIAVVVFPALVRRAPVGARLSEVIDRRHGFTVQVSLARPESRGKISLASPDPCAPPRIEPAYFERQEDMNRMIRAVSRMRDAFRAPQIAPQIASELHGMPGTDAQAVEDRIRAFGGTFYHPGGTCRMGSDPGAVVDPSLRVRGIKGLRVADSSIVPAPLSATMHAPSIMIGEKAADIIRAVRHGGQAAADAG